jgi:hypothetical protein
VVVLTGVKAQDQSDDLADKRVVDDLAQGGGQASVELMHSQARFITWNTKPSPAQQQHLSRLARRDLVAMDLPQSLLQHCTAKARRSLCILL